MQVGKPVLTVDRYCFRPILSEKLCRDVMKLLRDTFTLEGLQREQCSRGGKRVNEKKSKSDVTDSLKDSQCQKW